MKYKELEKVVQKRMRMFAILTQALGEGATLRTPSVAFATLSSGRATTLRIDCDRALIEQGGRRFGDQKGRDKGKPKASCGTALYGHRNRPDVEFVYCYRHKNIRTRAGGNRPK